MRPSDDEIRELIRRGQKTYKSRSLAQSPRVTETRRRYTWVQSLWDSAKTHAELLGMLVVLGMLVLAQYLQ